MTVIASRKRAARRIALRYRNPPSGSVQESIDKGRRVAAKAQSLKKKTLK